MGDNECVSDGADHHGDTIMTLDQALEIIQANKMPEYSYYTPTKAQVDEALAVVRADNAAYYDANPDCGHGVTGY